MSKIANAFKNGKAFIPFITCGDPDLATTAAVVRAAVENGADLIELGIPFSDPTAEGPVIQGANLRALKGGVNTDKVFDLVRDLRTDVTVPMVFMTYANVVFSYGSERFISTCAQIGIDGLILPDIPFEEKDDFLPICHKYGVDLISLIAPTSENRIGMIAKEAEDRRSVRNRLRYFNPRAGEKNGGCFRRRDCRFRDNQAPRKVRRGRSEVCRRVRQEYEGRYPRNLILRQKNRPSGRFFVTLILASPRKYS